MGKLPLAGIRVIDLSSVFSGPLCTRVLADLGAEVIKVESIQRPDGARTLTTAENDPQDDQLNRSAYFNKLNMNKRGITLDLTNPEGREILKRLIMIADVLVENYNPRVMPRFGLDYSVLSKLRPELILASLSGYGQEGPWAQWSAFGYDLEYACGLSYISGYADGPPGKQGINFTDPWAGVLAAGLIVAALHQRQRTGKGQWIDLSQRDIGSSYIGETLMDCAMNGRVQGRIGNRHPSMAPHGVYRCAGGREWVAIAVANDGQWRSLRAALSGPDWAQDPQFDTLIGRLAKQDFIDQHLEAWTVQRDHYTAMRELQAAGVPAGAVLVNREVMLDPHLRERGLYRIVENPNVGRRPYARQTPGWFSAWPEAGKEPRPAPTIGQHNEEVLGGLLGLGDEDLARLADQQIIGVEAIVEKLPSELVRQILKRRQEDQRRVGKIETIDPDYRTVLAALDPEKGSPSVSELPFSVGKSGK